MKSTLNKILISFFCFVFLIVLSSSTGAVEYADMITLSTPASNTAVVGNYTLNASNFIIVDNVVNCTFYGRSTFTDNSSWTRLGDEANSSANQSEFLLGFNSSEFLEDAPNYEFNATCSNITDYTDSFYSVTTTILVDNYVPNAPSSLSPGASTVDTDGSVTFSVTVLDTTTTGCSLYLGPVGYGMTNTAGKCTHTLTNIPEQSYDWYVQATDGTNISGSETISLRVETPKSAKKGALVLQQAGVNVEGKHSLSVAGKNNPLEVVKSFWWVILIIVVAGTLFWIKKKK